MATKIKFWALLVEQEEKDQFLLIFKESEDDSLTGFLPLFRKEIKGNEYFTNLLTSKPIEKFGGARVKRNEPFTLILNTLPKVRRYKDKEGHSAEALDLGNPHETIEGSEK
jgi:hypothetical protein